MKPEEKQQRFTGKTALIVGGTAGIGRSAALALAGEGAHVHIAGRNREAGESFVAECRKLPGSGAYHGFDLSDIEGIDPFIRNLHRETSGIDIAVNSAATPGRRTTFHEGDWEMLQQVVHLNCTATLRLLHSEIAVMRQAGGSIINITSTSGLRPSTSLDTYGATKAFLGYLTESLSVTYGPDGLRINAVSPGPTDTDMFRSVTRSAEHRQSYVEKTALRRIAEPEDVAAAILFLASEAAKNITGTILRCDGGSLFG